MTVKTMKIVQVLAPSGDLFNTDPTTKPVKFGAYGLAEFLLQKGVGATGTATIVAQLCDNPAGDNPVAIPFEYDRIDRLQGITEGTAVTTSGFTTNAADDDTYVIRVDGRMPEVSSQTAKPYLRLSITEVVDDPVPGGIVCYLSDGKEGNFHAASPLA